MNIDLMGNKVPHNPILPMRQIPFRDIQKYGRFVGPFVSKTFAEIESYVRDLNNTSPPTSIHASSSSTNHQEPAPRRPTTGTKQCRTNRVQRPRGYSYSEKTALLIKLGWWVDIRIIASSPTSRDIWAGIENFCTQNAGSSVEDITAQACTEAPRLVHAHGETTWAVPKSRHLTTTKGIVRSEELVFPRDQQRLIKLVTRLLQLRTRAGQNTTTTDPKGKGKQPLRSQQPHSTGSDENIIYLDSSFEESISEFPSDGSDYIQSEESVLGESLEHVRHSHQDAFEDSYVNQQPSELCEESNDTAATSHHIIPSAQLQGLTVLEALNRLRVAPQIEAEVRLKDETIPYIPFIEDCKSTEDLFISFEESFELDEGQSLLPRFLVDFKNYKSSQPFFLGRNDPNGLLKLLRVISKIDWAQMKPRECRIQFIVELRTTLQT